MIRENIERVRERMAQACKRVGRDPSQVRLICVTKEATIEQIREAISRGITEIGENRVQDAVRKFAQIGRETAEGDRLNWHMIGHLQTNKVKKAIEIFDLIHSVDSLRLAEAISKEAAEANKTQGILIQVNASGEETKFGVSPEGAEELIVRVSELEGIEILGLMTIAPLVDDPEKTRPCFKKLRQLSERVEEVLRATSGELRATNDEGRATRYERRDTILSMGMTQDFEVAIEEGSNMVRIGSAIFRG